MWRSQPARLPQGLVSCLLLLQECASIPISVACEGHRPLRLLSLLHGAYPAIGYGFSLEDTEVSNAAWRTIC